MSSVEALQALKQRKIRHERRGRQLEVEQDQAIWEAYHSMEWADIADILGISILDAMDAARRVDAMFRRGDVKTPDL